MSEERKRPQGFVIYENTLKMLSICTPVEAGTAMIAAANLFLSGEMPTAIDRVSEIVFNGLKSDIDSAFDKYSERCRRNKENRNKRKEVTSGDELLPVETFGAEYNGTEPNGTELEPNEIEPNGFEPF